MQRSNFRFAVALPLFSLTLSFFLVFSAHPAILSLLLGVRGAGETMSMLLPAPITLYEWLRASVSGHRILLPEGATVAASLNLPGMLFEVLCSVPTSWPDSWYPRLPLPGWDLFLWRAVSWPVFALPFWWMVGRSLDSLLQGEHGARRSRVRLGEAIFMGILCLLSGLCAIAGFVSFWTEGFHEETDWMFVACLLWCALGVLPVVAWFLQRKRSPDPLGAPVAMRVTLSE